MNEYSTYHDINLNFPPSVAMHCRALDVAEVGGGANFILCDQPINIEHAYDVVPLAPPTFQ